MLIVKQLIRLSKWMTVEGIGNKEDIEDLFVISLWAHSFCSANIYIISYISTIGSQSSPVPDTHYKNDLEKKNKQNGIHTPSIATSSQNIFHLF